MADFADVASAITEEYLQKSLEGRSQFNATSNFECEDCGVEIPAQRRTLGGVTRCIDCQTCVESQAKHLRG
ncbi:TraR/DksA C4-type zinc finger protein [Acinetobacter sp.]|uniref:TraR/DksA C4-type zinc finger protein n=1 Tax=unclassified Acinetobacter TaxID=196816 RepID=UPI0028ACD902|nr:TraR/DksA C4-type zinc finger protein [Acinetobacter sp.]